MDLLISRRADLLEEALSGVASPLPRPADGVEREIALARVLQRAGARTAPALSDDVRAALRSRLVAVAAVQGGGQTSGPPAPAAVSWRQRLGAVAAGLTASAVAVTGVAVAADRSLPGDPFYGVKRVAEDVQLRLAPGPAQEGRRHLQFAGERVRELRQLALGRDLAGRDEPLTGADATRVEALLDDLDAETRSASRLLAEAFRAGDAAPVEDLAAFAETARQGLTDVLPALPAGVRPRVQRSLGLVREVRTTAADLLLLRDCATTCDPAARPPVLPPLPGAPAVEEPCSCSAPPPAPSVAPPPASGPPAGSTAEPAPSAEPTQPGRAHPSGRPSPAASPNPSPSTQPGLPLPLPLDSPLPLPLESPLPVPLPTLSLPPLPPLDPVVPDGGLQVPPLTGAGGLLAGPAEALPAVAPVPGALVLVLRAWRG